MKLGLNLWSQATDWPRFLATSLKAEQLGYDHVWTWDHLYAIFGDPHQPIFEGYTALGAVAQATKRIRVGLFVGANTFRNPGLATKSLTTIDHISGGRAIMGIGGAWFEPEHRAFGIDFGRSPGERLAWLAEAAPVIRTLLDGGEATSPEGGRYSFDRLRNEPPPLQEHLPLMIGGGGVRKTLRIVAQHADMWNAFGEPEVLSHKDDVLRAHCADVGRDPASIERTVGCKVTIRQTEAEAQRVVRALLEHNRTPTSQLDHDDTFWTGTPEMLAEKMLSYRKIGFNTFIVELPAPYDDETIETLANEVRPMIERAPVPA
ncbi:MAG: LLM class flavin-dependent oxidoreductase [Chloroflexota bacterium]|nr:LLM class flavin-dependent oxidoreductase [Chloroflexota bacterium]